jgi:hypothetical protein
VERQGKYQEYQGAYDDCLRKPQATSPTIPTPTRNSGTIVGSGNNLQAEQGGGVDGVPFSNREENKQR